MCGIAGIVAGQTRAIGDSIERMLGAVEHRGPDAAQVVRLEDCHLGHARLSIIDLASGAQPMRSRDGRYWIVFNGEIYNYRALRAELLGLGATFTTESDTEVILAAYAAWGRACLPRLRGMYAFAIWDSQAKTLFAARDPFGEKPLYFVTMPNGGLLFASEIKGIEAARLLRTRLDLESVDAYLALGYVPPDRSIWCEIRPVPPAHYLEWDGGEVRLSRYWEPEQHIAPIGLEEAAHGLRERLSRAVQRQLVADVEVGAFLSGGHDSSTIVALAAEGAARRIKTFSVGFGDQINELGYARTVADRYATDHHEVDLGAPAVGELLERMVQVYDEPFADSSAIPTYLISEFARKHVKVVLSGDGGDELFGGYGWYKPLQMAERLPSSRLCWIALRLLSKALRDSSPGLQLRSSAFGLAARWPDTWTRTVMGETYFSGRERHALWGGRSDAPQSCLPGAYYRPPAHVQGLQQAFHFDLKSYLPGDILVKVDRASMAHGLECRSPLLDRDLAEYALSLPAALKVSRHDTKIVFKEAARGWWPREVRERGKHGFGAPYASWLALPEVRRVADRVFSRGSSLRELLPGVGAGPQPANYRTWMLLVLGLWLDRRAS
jgi:asparagine synthase (glutamine-hydrolysing)